jgi:hypothetical protein
MLGHLQAALARALMAIMLTFFIAGILTAVVIEGTIYLSGGHPGDAGSITLAIVFGVIIGVIAGFVTLLVEIIRGVRAGVKVVEGEVGKVQGVVQHGVDSSLHHKP